MIDVEDICIGLHHKAVTIFEITTFSISFVYLLRGGSVY